MQNPGAKFRLVAVRKSLLVSNKDYQQAKRRQQKTIFGNFISKRNMKMKEVGLGLEIHQDATSGSSNSFFSK